MDITRSTSPPKSAFRGINDVDTVVIPFNRGVFREDGNPTLFLQIVGVHHAFLGFGTRIKRTGLLQQLVNRVVLPWSTCAMMAMLRKFSITTLPQAFRNSALLYTD